MSTVSLTRSAVGSVQTIAQRRRCAVFLLQLLSNIFKSERGSSHPERANHGPASDSPSILQRDSKKKAVLEWEKEAVQACAKVANGYLIKMVQAAATATEARGESGDPNADQVAGSRLNEEDLGYWVFALLSDVLKYLRKDNWSCGGGSSSTTRWGKRQRDGERRGQRIVPALLPSPATPAEARGAPDDEGRSSGLVVDFSSLAKVVAAFPLGRGKGAMDAALKWLEVTKASVLLLAGESSGSCPLCMVSMNSVAVTVDSLVCMHAVSTQ